MLKKYIIMFLFFSSFKIFSQFPIEIGIVVTNDMNQKPQSLSFGVHPLATDNVDDGLGELSYPPIPPMGNIFFAVFDYTDSSTFNSDGSKYYDLIWTNKDLRAVKKPINIFEEYSLNLFWGTGSKLNLVWTTLPIGIDSAFITDPFDGIVIKTDMKKKSTLELTNISINRLKIKVWYHTPNSVTVESAQDKVNVSPNPFTDILNISIPFEYQNYKIFDLFGNIITESNDITKNIILDTKSLINGYYFITITDLNNMISSVKLLKIDK